MHLDYISHRQSARNQIPCCMPAVTRMQAHNTPDFLQGHHLLPWACRIPHVELTQSLQEAGWPCRRDFSRLTNLFPQSSAHSQGCRVWVDRVWRPSDDVLQLAEGEVYSVAGLVPAERYTNDAAAWSPCCSCMGIHAISHAPPRPMPKSNRTLPGSA